MNIAELVEFKNFGFNALTISSSILVIATVAEARQLNNQACKIMQESSGKALGNCMFIFSSFMFLSLIVYGWHIHSGVLMLNGMLFVFYFRIMKLIKQWKGFSRADSVIFFTCAALLIAMIIFPVKKSIFLIFNYGSLLALLSQPWEMWKVKSSGVIEIKLFIVYFITTSFWFLYAIAIKDWLLFITTMSALSVLGFVIGLWLYFENSSKAKYYQEI